MTERGGFLWEHMVLVFSFGWSWEKTARSGKELGLHIELVLSFCFVGPDLYSYSSLRLSLLAEARPGWSLSALPFSFSLSVNNTCTTCLENSEDAMLHSGLQERGCWAGSRLKEDTHWIFVFFLD